MVIVELVQNKYTEEWYYRAIDRYSASCLDGCTNQQWFYPSNWQWIEKSVRDRYGCKLTNKWIHRKRAYKDRQSYGYWE